MIIKPEQCGAILNDFQTILGAGYDTPKCTLHDVWSPAIEESLVTIRNWMNLTKKMWLGKEIQGRYVYCTPRKITKSSKQNRWLKRLKITPGSLRYRLESSASMGLGEPRMEEFSSPLNKQNTFQSTLLSTKTSRDKEHIPHGLLYTPIAVAFLLTELSLI